MFSFPGWYVFLFILITASGPSYTVPKASPDFFLYALTSKLLVTDVNVLLETYNMEATDSESNSMTYPSIKGRNSKEKAKTLFDLMVEKGFINTLNDLLPLFKTMGRYDLVYDFREGKAKEVLDTPLKRFNSATSSVQEAPNNNSSKDMTDRISKLEEKLKVAEENLETTNDKYQEHYRAMTNLDIERRKLFGQYEVIKTQLSSEKKKLSQMQGPSDNKTNPST